MEHILELPKVTCLLLSLAKNAGLSANNSSELAYKGKEFFLDAYQKALKNKTLQINIHKNKITFPMEEHDSGFHAVGVLTVRLLGNTDGSSTIWPRIHPAQKSPKSKQRSRSL